MLATIYIRSFDGDIYRTSLDGISWSGAGEYLVPGEIKKLGLIGPGFWSLTAESRNWSGRKAYHLVSPTAYGSLPYELIDLAGPATKSVERRAIERRAVIRYLEIWQDTVRGKISRHHSRCIRGEYYYKKLGELYAEQESVQRRLRIVRTKGLAH